MARVVSSTPLGHPSIHSPDREAPGPEGRHVVCEDDRVPDEAGRREAEGLRHVLHGEHAPVRQHPQAVALLALLAQVGAWR